MSDPEYQYGGEGWWPIPNVVSGYSFDDLADAAAHDFWDSRDGWEIGGPFKLIVRSEGVIKEYALTPEWDVRFDAIEVVK